MRNPMTDGEVEELYRIARIRCETLALFRDLQQGARLNPEQEQRLRRQLDGLELRLRRIKSENEVDRQRALMEYDEGFIAQSRQSRRKLKAAYSSGGTG